LFAAGAPLSALEAVAVTVLTTEKADVSNFRREGKN